LPIPGAAALSGAIHFARRDLIPVFGTQAQRKGIRIPTFREAVTTAIHPTV
jgi:hypothetical protein